MLTRETVDVLDIVRDHGEKMSDFDKTVLVNRVVLRGGYNLLVLVL